jgi:hypothetical protein
MVNTFPGIEQMVLKNIFNINLACFLPLQVISTGKRTLSTLKRGIPIYSGLFLPLADWQIIG